MSTAAPLPRRVTQIAFVVRDINEAKARFARLFGLPEPGIMTTAPGFQCAQTFEGEPSDAQAYLAFFDLENVQLELIQPLGGASSWQAFLDAHGEGVHHLGFWTEDLPASREGLAAEKMPEMHYGQFDGGEFSYADSASQMGCLIELLGKR